MSRHQATFEIRSKADAYAVRLLVDRVYDAIREELRESGDDASPGDETLDELRAIREAVRRPSPGTLTIVYESRDEPLEE